jgi:hypothetical protein
MILEVQHLSLKIQHFLRRVLMLGLIIPILLQILGLVELQLKDGHLLIEHGS